MTDACGASWDTDFFDCYQGIQTYCDHPPGHDGDHAGPVLRHEGDEEKIQAGMRLSWPRGDVGEDDT